MRIYEAVCEDFMVIEPRRQQPYFCTNNFLIYELFDCILTYSGPGPDGRSITTRCLTTFKSCCN